MENNRLERSFWCKFDYRNLGILKGGVWGLVLNILVVFFLNDCERVGYCFFFVGRGLFRDVDFFIVGRFLVCFDFFIFCWRLNFFVFCCFIFCLSVFVCGFFDFICLIILLIMFFRNCLILFLGFFFLGSVTFLLVSWFVLLELEFFVFSFFFGIFVILIVFLGRGLLRIRFDIFDIVLIGWWFRFLGLMLLVLILI